MPEGLAEAQKAKPLGLFGVMGKFFSRDTWRVMVATACILQTVGKSFGPKKSHRSGCRLTINLNRNSRTGCSC